MFNHHRFAFRLLPAVCLLFAALTIQAQEPADESWIPPTLAQLNLSGGQKAKLKPLIGEHRQKIKAVRDDAALSEEAKAEKIKSLNQDYNKQLGDLLTDKQRDKLAELRKANRKS